MLTVKTHPVECVSPPGDPRGFTFVILPDTQVCSENARGQTRNPWLEAWVTWTQENLSRHRIKFVSHVGDLVDMDRPEAWEAARLCLDRLHGRVPYAIAPGNKEVTREGESTVFQQWFGAWRFRAFDWYGGCFPGLEADGARCGNNADSWQAFEQSGTRFLWLHLECNAPAPVLDWAQKVVERQAHDCLLLTVHMGLGPIRKPQEPEGYFNDAKGIMTWKKRHLADGLSPAESWTGWYRHWPRLRLIFSGDQSRTQALRLEFQGRHGNRVDWLTADYWANGFRLVRFLPGDRRIEVRTINPLLGMEVRLTRLVPDESQHRFDLPW